MNPDQMTVEQVHETQDGNYWRDKYERLEKDFRRLEGFRDEWATKATERQARINELEEQLKSLRSELQMANVSLKSADDNRKWMTTYKTKLEEAEKENKKLAQSVERAKAIVKAHNVAYLALLKISERETGGMTHQQRKILAEVRFKILEQLGIGVSEKKGAEDTEYDPIPFKPPVHDEF